MTDLQEWLKPEDLKHKMAMAYLDNNNIESISKIFGYTVPTVRYMLRDHMPTEAQTNEFKKKFVRKQIKKLGGKL